MGSTVTTRPNHYEVLGIAPTATREEISRAFTREMSMLRPRPFGGLAELTVAHAVLGDPARRRAYDRELGLVAKEEKPALTLSTHGAGSASFARAAVPLATPVERPAIALAPEPEPPVQRPTPPTRTRPIGEALAELARPEPLVKPAEVAPQPAPPPRVNRLDLAPEEDWEESPARAVAWKPVAIAGGAVVALVAVIGAWAGWQSSGGVPAKASVNALLTPPDTDFTVSDPAAAAALGSDVPAPDDATSSPRAAPRHRVTGRRVVSHRQSSRLAAIEQGLAEPAPAATVPPDVPAGAGDAPASATPASMPLSNATIARTIGRIGYPCGSVASTSQILGKAFTVTCTSGHTYRAAPVRGRYHFRKVASR